MFLTDEEIKVLTMRFATTRGDQGFTEHDLTRALDWAEDVRFAEALLEGVINGLLTIDVDEKGELRFGLTAAGLRYADALPDEADLRG